MPAPRLVLASASPRRLELLRTAGYQPLVDPAHVDETPDPSRSPAENAAAFARDKALVVAARRPGDLVLGADTIVTIGRELLGKPRDADDARRMLRRLAGRLHHVITCVFLAEIADWPQTALSVSTAVVFRDLGDDEIEAYIATNEWTDKAGGYAVQGHAAAFTQAVIGSYTNVVGLPVTEVAGMLGAEGYPIHFNWMKFAEVDQS